MGYKGFFWCGLEAVTGFHVFTEDINIRDFRNVTSCYLVDGTNVLEEPLASVFRRVSKQTVIFSE